MRNFKKKLLAQACAAALVLPALNVHALLCVGDVSLEFGAAQPDTEEPVVELINQGKTLLAGGESTVLSSNITVDAAHGATIYPSICSPQGGTFSPDPTDPMRLIYTASTGFSADTWVLLTLNVADGLGHAIGSSVWVKVQATVLAGSVSGYIYDANGNPLAGVTVNIGGQTTATDASGYYQISGLADGTYILTPLKDGYAVESLMVTINADNPNVTASPIRKPKLSASLVVSKATGNNEIAIYTTTGEETRRFETDTSGDELNVRSIDLNADGIREAIAAARGQGGREIKVYTIDGTAFTEIGAINVDASGIHFAANDLDGDGMADFVLAPNSSNRNQVDAHTSAQQWQKTSSTTMFDQSTRMSPALGDVNGDGLADTIAGDLQGKNGKNQGDKSDVISVVLSGSGERIVFPVFTDSDQIHGVNVFAYDVNCDGKDEIIAAMADKGARVEIYTIENGAAVLLNQFSAFADYQHGIEITAGDVTLDGIPEIITGQAKGNLLSIFDTLGGRITKFSTETEGHISSLAVTGGGACGTQPTPAQAVVEINEEFVNLGYSHYRATQENGVIIVTNEALPDTPPQRYRQDKRVRGDFSPDAPPGLHRLNDKEDYVLVTKTGQQLVFRPLR